jgi:hypothetical protein
MQRRLNRWIHAIGERRREVAQVLAQGHSEIEIKCVLNFESVSS